MLRTLLDNAYWLLFAGTMLEGESALLLASVGASQGLLDLKWVILFSFAGAITGDQISYQIFRRFGPALIARNPTLRRRSEKARRLLAGHPVKFIIVSRFFWGLRSACMLALAASDVRTRTFAPANIFACALWAIAVGTLGYVFSSGVGRLLEAMNTISGRAPAVIAGMLVFLFVIFLLRWAVLRFWRSRDSL
jgi:membrane protein DedA with SNARE-associated domain